MVLAALLCAACASNVSLSHEERRSVHDALEREPRRYLRASVYLLPELGPEGRSLIDDGPRSPEGTDASTLRVLPVGTPVRVERLVFPGAWHRLGASDRPWLLLRGPEGRGLALPLPEDLDRTTTLWAELDHYLARRDPADELQAFGPRTLSAVRTKRAFVGMPARALEMAWGRPRTRIVDHHAGQRRERWRYAARGLIATVENGWVTALTELPADD